MDQAHDYLTDTLEGKDQNIGDFVSIIVLAVLEADGDYAKASTFLSDALEKFNDSPLRQQAVECFSSAIHHLDVFEEARVQ